MDVFVGILLGAVFIPVLLNIIKHPRRHYTLIKVAQIKGIRIRSPKAINKL